LQIFRPVEKFLIGGGKGVPPVCFGFFITFFQFPAARNGLSKTFSALPDSSRALPTTFSKFQAAFDGFVRRFLPFPRTSRVLPGAFSTFPASCFRFAGTFFGFPEWFSGFPESFYGFPERFREFAESFRGFPRRFRHFPQPLGDFPRSFRGVRRIILRFAGIIPGVPQIIPGNPGMVGNPRIFIKTAQKFKKPSFFRFRSPFWTFPGIPQSLDPFLALKLPLKLNAGQVSRLAPQAQYSKSICLRLFAGCHFSRKNHIPRSFSFCSLDAKRYLSVHAIFILQISRARKRLHRD
jgi:hypothetical protein